jgi:small subunit ribosomal protein S16
MVKIRLSRAGAKKRPFYSIVAVDGHARRDGRPLEYLGTYNPVTTPKQLQLDAEKIEAWVKRGAQVSDTVAALLREQRRRNAATGAA